MKHLFNLVIFVLLLTACQNAPATVETTKVEAATPAPVVDEWANKAFYSASDFGLPQGKIMGWTWENEEIQRRYENNEEVLIKIIEPSGHIVVVPCPYKAWESLPEGAILK